MILADFKTDSLLVYSDWLIDNGKEKLALEIRIETKPNDWFYEYIYDIGAVGFSSTGIGDPADDGDHVGTEIEDNWGNGVGNPENIDSRGIGSDYHPDYGTGVRDMIFSGDESKKLWKRINRLSKKKSYKKRKKLAKRISRTLYLMGCKLQELESLVRKQNDHGL